MAITTIKLPHTVALTGVPMPVKISTDALYSTEGVKQKGSLAITTNMSVGDDFTLTWDGGQKSQTFEIVAGLPDDSGTQITVKGAESFPDWVDNKVLPTLRANPVLFEDYDVFESNNAATLHLLARKEGTDYNATISSNWTVASPEYFTNGVLDSVAGVDAAINENFKLQCEIWVANDWEEQSFTRASTLEKVPDENGQAVFFINKVLDAYTRRSLPKDKLTAIQEDNITQKYFLKLIEYYGDPATTQSVKTTVIYHAIKGGYNESLGADYPASTGYIWNKIFGDDRFLTQAKRPTYSQSHEKAYRIDTNHTEELLFINKSASVTTLVLEITGYLSLYPFTYITTSLQLASVEQYKTYKIPVGLRNIYTQLAAYLSILDHYTVQLLDQDDNPVSEIVGFALDKQNKRVSDYLLFPNSLGNYDSFRLTGPKRTIKEEESETFQETLPFNYTGKDSPTGFVNYEGFEIIEQSTGWLNNDEKKHLANELLHKDAPAFILEDEKLVAVQILNSSFEKHNTDVDMSSLRVRYQKLHSDNFYTND